MLKNEMLNELFFGNIKDFFWIKTLIAYNALASVSFMGSYFSTLFGF